MKKRLSCFTLILVILVNIVTVAYAKNDINENKFLNENSYKSNELYFQLVEVGFSDEEIIELYQKEADSSGIDFKLPEILQSKTNISKVVSQNTSPKTMMLYANNGDTRHRTISVNFNDVARYCGWPGGGTSAAFIIGNVTKSEFIKAVIANTGLQWVAAVTTVVGIAFGYISRYHEGIDLYLTETYYYDEYELMGKWTLVDADYRLWWYIMVLVLSTILILLYISNHKKNSLKRLPILLTLTSIIFLIFYYFFRRLDLYMLYASIGIACSIDNLIYFYQKKNMGKKNEVK